MKKYIYIIRHAKSSWTDPLIADHDRPLDSRGLRDAPVMADVLKQSGYVIDKIVSSTANRARTTAGYFAETYGLEIELENQLYHGTPDHYMDVMQVQPETVMALAMFGHNPGITWLANLLKNNVIDNVPTCGIIICSVNSDILWQNIEWNDITLVSILTPKNPVP